MITITACDAISYIQNQVKTKDFVKEMQCVAWKKRCNQKRECFELTDFVISLCLE